MSTQSTLDPTRIGSPIQLLAAMLVLVPILIAGAATIRNPSWMAAVLSIAAVVVALVVIAVAFRLLTRHREELLDNKSLTTLRVKALEVAPRVEVLLHDAGYDDAAIVAGRRETTGGESTDQDLKLQVDKLSTIVNELRVKDGLGSVPPEALLETAKVLMVQHKWTSASEYYDQYVKSNDQNWAVHFSRAVAHANARTGTAGNLTALRAYDDAIALAPGDTDRNILGRLFTYRAAMKKRLGRLDEAEADLRLAQLRVSKPREIVDLAYNCAAVYALMGRKAEALEQIRRLSQMGKVHLVRSRIDTYFKGISEDLEFRRLVPDESASTRIDEM